MLAEDNRIALLDEVEEWLRLLEQWLPKSLVLAKLWELQTDMREDYCTIVVVGEFKHGKSTFVNALLGETIMPANATPTTATLNAVFYGEKKEVRVKKSGGATENLGQGYEALERFTADQDFDLNEIDYVRIDHTSPILHNRTVLVDTPGVNDLNHHRAEVTHRFIPRADLVIVMLNLLAPMSRTEQQFIERYLLRHGTDHLLFVANFADMVDEEEIDDTMEHLRRRLVQVTGNPAPPLFKISALDALRAKLQDDNERVIASGILEVEKEIRNKLTAGLKMEAKHTSRSWRLHYLLLELIEELENEIAVLDASSETLQENLAQIGEWKASRDKWEKQLDDYLTNHGNEIVYMALKSFRHFGERLRSEAEMRVHHHQGPDVRSLTESYLPMYIKMELTHWFDQYTDSIRHMLSQLEAAVSQGLSQAFRESVRIKGDRIDRLQPDYNGVLRVHTGGNPYLKAGLLVGGVSSVALMMGGAFIIPIIGMAGLPFLQQKMAAKNLESMKPYVLEALNQHLDELYDSSSEAIRSYIGSSVSEIKRKALEEFQRLIQAMESAVMSELERKSKDANQSMQLRQQLVLLLDNAMIANKRIEEEFA